MHAARCSLHDDAPRARPVRAGARRLARDHAPSRRVALARAGRDGALAAPAGPALIVMLNQLALCAVLLAAASADEAPKRFNCTHSFEVRARLRSPLSSCVTACAACCVMFCLPLVYP